MTLVPGPSALLRGVRQTLDEEILPELRSLYARGRLQTVIKVLNIVSERWEELAPFVFDENAGYCSLLQEVRASLLREPGADAKIRDLAADIGTGLELYGKTSRQDRPPTLVAMTVENQGLKALARHVLACLDCDRSRTVGVPEEIRARMARYFVLQLNRERELLPLLPWEAPECRHSGEHACGERECCGLSGDR